MKHSIIVVLLVISTGLLAQSEKPIEKGQKMVGGGASFGYGIELTDTETTSGEIRFSLYPSVGFFVAHGFALGASPSFSISGGFGDITNTYTSVGLGIFLIKYFDIGLFVRGTIDYDFNLRNYETTFYSDKSRSHSLSFIPAVGYAFFLGPNVSLEIALNDRFELGFAPDESVSVHSRTYFSAGFQIFL